MTSIDDLTKCIRNVSPNKGFISLSQNSKPQLHFNSHYYRKNLKPTKDGKFKWLCPVPRCNASCSSYSDSIAYKYLIYYYFDFFF